MSDLSLQRDITRNSLQVGGINQVVRLSKGQKGLLNLLRECVKNQKPLTWDRLFECYYANMKQLRYDRRIVTINEKHEWQWFSYDIKDSYLAQDNHWKYTVRSSIRMWFTSTLGALVLKNQLVVIPTIEIEESDTSETSKQLI